MNQAGYRDLTTYMLATVIYDLTYEFCNVYLSGPTFGRLREQMIHAARSGRQNIAEGYEEKSLKSYIKLLGVARASQVELLLDYEDYLRQRKLEIWDKNDPRIRVFREFRVIWLDDNHPNSPNLPNSPTEAANLLITLISQATYLMDKQLKSLEEKFIKEGGYTEKLFRERLAERNKRQ